MRIRLLLLMTTAALFGCKRESAKAETLPGADIPGAKPSIQMVSPVPNGEWTLPAGDLANTRFTPLAQITSANAGTLKLAGTFSTGVPRGHEGQPLVVGDTMYVVTPAPNYLMAIDLRSPTFAEKWRYSPNPDGRAQGVACCDVVNRGASYGDGKIVYNLIDTTTVAVDATTGKEAWRTKTGDPDNGETITMAPLIVKDRVLVGNSGGELGVRGKMVALDVHDGHEVWRAYNTGSDTDCRFGPTFKPFYEKDRGKDLGVSSWAPDQWKLGGATIWGWVSYDPELDLLYYGTSNPGSWNPDLRPGDNKWSLSILARSPSDGSARWAYQVAAHDAWDYDEINENVLVDMEWGGRMRKLLLHAGRTGFLFVMDRETGEVLAADKFEPTNWASSYDLTTGKPVEDPEKRTHTGKTTRGICPSSTGAKEFAPTAFSPRTGLLYIPGHNTCMDYEATDANYIAGTPYLGASVKMYPGPGGYQGELIGWDVVQKRKAWSVKEEKYPLTGGVLATGGDLVFYGTMDGWLKAVDAISGAERWKYKVASGIVGNPISYVGPDGKQYVAVYAGIGGWLGIAAHPFISDDDPYAALGIVGTMKGIKHDSAPGSVIYVFGL